MTNDLRCVRYLAAVIFGVCAFCGCATDPPSGDANRFETARALWAPHGIAVHHRYIVVANAAFEFEGARVAYETGFISLIDRRTRAVVSRIPTSQKNPQHVTVVGDVAYVLNGGSLDIVDGLGQATSSGGLDMIDLSSMTPPTSVSVNIELPLSASDVRIGSYGSFAVRRDGKRALIGSGTRADLFLVDLEQRRLLRGPDNPIVLFETPAGENGLTIVRPLDADRVALLSFNNDVLCLSSDWDGEFEERHCAGVGIDDELLEGPIDVVSIPGTTAPKQFLVLMTIANSLYSVEYADDRINTRGAWIASGLATNRVIVDQRYAYVVNSLSNNIQRVSVDEGENVMPFSTLPVGSNPYDIAVSNEPEGRVAWVTLLASHEVAVVRLDDGTVVQRIGSTLDAAVDLGSSADGSVDCGPQSRVQGVESIERVNFGAGAGVGQDDSLGAIAGGPRGGGLLGGATKSVLSLGEGGEIVLSFGDVDIIDGPGPDFIVYENPFLLAPFQSFAEPARVGVSATGIAEADFVDFDCDVSVTLGDAEQERWPFPGCAGVRPVLANAETNCLDPTDPEIAGGDAFDLSALSIARARYLRLKDASGVRLGQSSRGFDLDSVVLINYGPRSE